MPKAYSDKLWKWAWDETTRTGRMFRRDPVSGEVQYSRYYAFKTDVAKACRQRNSAIRRAMRAEKKEANRER